MKTVAVKKYTGCKCLVFLCSCALMFFFAGCESVPNKPTFAEQIKILKEEKSQLQGQADQAETENKQLQKRLNVLAGLKADQKSKTIYNLIQVKLTKYTNFYDKDNNGKKEKLIVYLQPIDEYGDIIKAAGAVDVQLWDLNKKDNALLKEWHINPQELQKLWFAAIVTINYRLTFDLDNNIDGLEGPLTVKVSFTDYLTGKVFEEQKVIKPQ